ncbi:MAG: hypothetical protein WBD87_02725 [Candidatus Acidiferrales bacterium]
MNQQLVDNQSLYAKRDKLLGRQAAEVAQLIGSRNGGGDVFGAKYCRERQIRARHP